MIHYLLQAEWITNDPNKNKKAESEIRPMQEEAVPENTKKAMKFGLKVFKGYKKLPTFEFRAVSGHVLGNHRLHQSKRTRR